MGLHLTDCEEGCGQGRAVLVAGFAAELSGTLGGHVLQAQGAPAQPGHRGARGLWPCLGRALCFGGQPLAGGADHEASAVVPADQRSGQAGGVAGQGHVPTSHHSGVGWGRDDDGDRVFAWKKYNQKLILLQDMTVTARTNQYNFKNHILPNHFNYYFFLSTASLDYPSRLKRSAQTPP